MNRNVRRNFAAVTFLVAAPLLGLSCATSKKNTEVPPATVQSTVATPNQGEATPDSPPTPQVPTPKKKLTAARMVCELDKDKRTVVYRMKGTGCVVTYTKFGHSKVAVESADGTDRCDNVFDRYKHNLTASGFACREKD